MKEIKNKSAETIAHVNDKNEVIPVEGKETELINALYSEINNAKTELIELNKQLNVAAVLEKSIREGLIK